MRAILLVPAVLDPHKLLAAGVCGARPPVAHLDHVAGKPPRPCPVCNSPLRWFSAPTDQTDSKFICAADWSHKFRQVDVLIPEWQDGAGYGAPYPHALVLAWEGQPAPEGVFRAWDRWGPDEDREFAATDLTTYDVLGEALDSLRGCEWLARACERIGLGEVVVLDGEAP